MYRLSYRDLQWDTVYLRPCFYTMQDGVRTAWGSSELPADAVCADPERHTVSVGMPEGQGKITDAGYDQMICVAAQIPVCDHVIFRGTVRILRYPLPEERNGQEGLGLFFRDTLAPDPLNGYPYASMAAAGIFRGRPALFGREGITREDIEHIRNFFCPEGPEVSPSLTGKKLEVVLEKQGDRLTASVTAEDGMPAFRRETTVDEACFSSRDPKMLHLGFLAARGCRMEVDLDTVSVEYADRTAAGSTLPVLYASPEGDSAGRGTPEAPLDLQSAVDRCQNGQEIRVLPGRYRLKEDLVIPARGSSSRCFRKIAAEERDGAQAVLDFGGSGHGLRIDGSWWDISGLTVVRGLGYMIRGSHNRIRYCQAVCNMEAGFLIRHPSNDAPKEQWPSYNEVADCVSCLNRDPSEQHADGFACKVTAGPGNTFLRCTAWMNSDDGFDLFSKNRSIGAVRLEECRSWLNGYVPQDGRLAETRGNGNGFKLGGSGLAADHEAVRCEAVGNRGFGFTSNSNPRMRLDGCAAGNNRKNYVYYYSGPEAQAVRVLENCTENDDPAFEPAAWAREHILSGIGGSGPFPSADEVLQLLRKNSVRDSNDSALRDAVAAVRPLAGEEDPDRPGVLIMCSSLYGGGAERVACHLACGLVKRHRVFMVYIQDKGETYPLDPDIQILAMPKFRGTWQEVMDGRIEYVRQVKKLLKIRAAVSFMFTMNKVNVRSGGDLKVICSERNNPAKRDPEHLKEIEGLYEKADHVVFQSRAVRDLFSQKVRDHAGIIVNPVAVSCGRTESRHRIVNVGRLVPQKDQAMLIRAFAAFRRDHDGYTLSFYGIGELAEELQDLADRLGLGDAVQFHGQVRNVHAAVADAEMFVLSSVYEGLSNALLECMMMGLPCISTRCEGSVDVIRSGENGILVDIGSEEQMTEAMTRLAEDAALRERLGAQARETSAQFRTERVLEQWEQLISGGPGGCG